MRTGLVCMTLAMALAMPGTAMAGEEGQHPAAPKRQWLGKAEVEAKVSAAGYTVKRTRNGIGRYEIRAKGKNGKTITLFVSPWTGEIVGQDTKWGGR
jgi:hypothetical protein